MASAKNERTFWSEMKNVSLYKKNQGRLTRQLTFLALLVILLVAVNTFRVSAIIRDAATNAAVCVAIAAAGAWAIYRLVNYPRFADFLISVEAEMDKVTWASRRELYQATVVVITTMFFLGFLLFIYDTLWVKFFQWIHFLEI